MSKPYWIAVAGAAAVVAVLGLMKPKTAAHAEGAEAELPAGEGGGHRARRETGGGPDT